MSRTEHEFQFSADRIAEAAGVEAAYHESRAGYWKSEYDAAVATVKRTAGVKVKERPITGGYDVDVVVDYGDAAAYSQMRRAFSKIAEHQNAADRFRSEEVIYATQSDRTYELSTADVHYFRLGGGERPE